MQRQKENRLGDPPLTGQGAVIIVAGKRPRSGTILDDLAARLIAAGISVSLDLPHKAEILSTEHWSREALIVHRGLSRTSLEHLTAAEDEGWRICNGAAASLLALDRPALVTRLRTDGLPVPDSGVFADWTTCRAASEGHDVVLKAVDGSVGRGEQVVFGGRLGLPVARPFEGPYILEERVSHDGIDRKLYVAGGTCFGLLKPWPRTQDPGIPFDPSVDLQEIAFGVGRAIGLEIFGVDIVVSPEGPIVVDVNVFPGFRGVEGAGEAVARHVMRLAERSESEC